MMLQVGGGEEGCGDSSSEGSVSQPAAKRPRVDDAGDA